MGMTIIGDNPLNEIGEEHRRGIWTWHPLAAYVCSVAPDITQHCTNWHSNDGDGLNAEQSVALADVLDKEIAEGRTAEYVLTWTTKMHSLPHELCILCDAKGVRRDHLGQDDGQPDRMIPDDAMDATDPFGLKPHPRRGQKGWCNGCDGRGYSRPVICHERLYVEIVQEWATFLRHCGGFKIR